MAELGVSFSIIKLDKPDEDYPEVLQNEESVEIYTSKYDLAILENYFVLDYVNAGLQMKNDSQLLDGAVNIGDGPALLKANHNVNQGEVRTC